MIAMLVDVPSAVHVIKPSTIDAVPGEEYHGDAFGTSEMCGSVCEAQRGCDQSKKFRILVGNSPNLRLMVRTTLESLLRLCEVLNLPQEDISPRGAVVSSTSREHEWAPDD